MADVGIRALQQNASAGVARAAAGETITITITERGRPVARMVPVRQSRLQELIDAGLVDPPKGRGPSCPRPSPARRSRPSSCRCGTRSVTEVAAANGVPVVAPA